MEGAKDKILKNGDFLNKKNNEIIEFFQLYFKNYTL